MPIPKSKQSLRDAIQENYSKFRKELNPALASISNLKELDGHVNGSLMSLNNLLSYLIGWGRLVLKWAEKKERGEHVEFPETGYKWNQLGLLAQKFYADYQTDDYDTLCRKLDLTVEAILQLIDSKTNEQLYEEPWYKEWTLGRMIQFNSSSPYANARQRIRKWKKTRTQQEQLS